MDVIVDEANLSVYANRAEQYTRMLAGCITQYAEIISGILGPGQGLYDTDITERLREMVLAAENMRQPVTSAGQEIAAALRNLITQTREADRYSWQDGGFDDAEAQFSVC